MHGTFLCFCTFSGFESPFLFLLTILFIAESHAIFQFGYIDDEDGDSVTGLVPIYTPSNFWQQGDSCIVCFLAFDPAQMFHGTWHSITHQTPDPAATVEFNFTDMWISLDVYCLLPNFIFEDGPLEDYTSTYNLSFVLDGQPVGKSFTHTSDFSGVTQYNVSVLSLSNLSQVLHTFTMIGASTVDRLTIQFDYARYTFDNDASLSPPVTLTTSTLTSSQSHSVASISSTPTIPSTFLSSSTSHKPVTSVKSTTSSTLLPSNASVAGQKKNLDRTAIIGGSIGGIFTLFLLLTLVFIYRRYKHRIRQRFLSNPRLSDRIDPFDVPPSSIGRYLMHYGDAALKTSRWSSSDAIKGAAPVATKRAAKPTPVYYSAGVGEAF
ncbi:hypothetical protein C8J55DRAFT_604034 [Lentinula edodes]|uniref:Mid2 domain-containing protein n=1 Tax=Lentinula lateritia TaxID=40482 RepID=A0A9W9AU02_9AGAR|nr:hypothetical protein C8J55DRAFT_604034 [Lentinula edodes]